MDDRGASEQRLRRILEDWTSKSRAPDPESTATLKWLVASNLDRARSAQMKGVHDERRLLEEEAAGIWRHYQVCFPDGCTPATCMEFDLMKERCITLCSLLAVPAAIGMLQDSGTSDGLLTSDCFEILSELRNCILALDVPQRNSDAASSAQHRSTRRVSSSLPSQEMVKEQVGKSASEMLRLYQMQLEAARGDIASSAARIEMMKAEIEALMRRDRAADHEPHNHDDLLSKNRKLQAEIDQSAADLRLLRSRTLDSVSIAEYSMAQAEVERGAQKMKRMQSLISRMQGLIDVLIARIEALVQTQSAEDPDQQTEIDICNAQIARLQLCIDGACPEQAALDKPAPGQGMGPPNLPVSKLSVI